MTMYWRFFNFLVRRILAVSFAVGGVIISLTSMHAVLPGGTINVDGQPSTDLVLRWFAVGFPLVAAALGVALYRAKPFTRGS
jgi:hypothetical protein